MAPRQGRTDFKLDVAAILCSFVNSQGEHLVVLGVSGLENVMTIFGDNNEGALMIKVRLNHNVFENDNSCLTQIRNERETSGLGRVIVAVGHDFETTLASTLEQARTLFSSTECTERHSACVSSEKFGRDWADLWINTLIYSKKCHSVSSHQTGAVLIDIGPVHNVHEQQTKASLITDMQALSARSIEVSGLVLDDFWQTVDQNQPSRYLAGLVDFEANPVVFGPGLQNTVAEICSKHKSVRCVIATHSIFGHWGGVSEDPSGSIQQKYKTVRVQRSEAVHPGPKTELTISLVSSRDIQRFFDDYYK